jgi:hypothetical protein
MADSQLLHVGKKNFERGPDPDGLDERLGGNPELAVGNGTGNDPPPRIGPDPLDKERWEKTGVPRGI